MSPQPRLLLASSSPYRRQLLERLRLPFDCASPDIDESPLPGEPPESLAVRLAESKAEALAGDYPQHLIIGSDQVAVTGDGHRLEKPGHFDVAREQLGRCSGQSVRFLTGLCLLDARTGSAWSVCEPYQVHFRNLTGDEINRYLTLEEPFDCAGSFRMEGLGIALFRHMEGSDPNSLIGLPLIALVDLLRDRGIDPLGAT
ncbi:MAF protein [Tamilnaduibacter salinus]|uniref:7-methyl-GTP pyrophosphatase n=1 Tax=Tamilnaduibacter salinus TaxID=1484056 RepID=A0A2U1CVH2_9GAMM|nr:Maf family nucleotide pyrophosphatase [Tamilnaduibacter salinus]PVY75414.1 MAF protein [Tamilnaduibacter salinus]